MLSKRYQESLEGSVKSLVDAVFDIVF